MSSGKPKVLVAMSGGVDSSVAAALCSEGYEVGCSLLRLPVVDEWWECSERSQRRAVPPRGASLQRYENQISHRGCTPLINDAPMRLAAADSTFSMMQTSRRVRSHHPIRGCELTPATTNPAVRICNDDRVRFKLHFIRLRIVCRLSATALSHMSVDLGISMPYQPWRRSLFGPVLRPVRCAARTAGPDASPDRRLSKDTRTGPGPRA